MMIQTEHVTRLIGYMEKTVGRHDKYGRDYFICMFLNIANVVLQIVITNELLSGQFFSYGLRYSYGNVQTGIVPIEDIIFPKMSK